MSSHLMLRVAERVKTDAVWGSLAPRDRPAKSRHAKQNKMLKLMESTSKPDLCHSFKNQACFWCAPQVCPWTNPFSCFCDVFCSTLRWSGVNQSAMCKLTVCHCFLSIYVWKDIGCTPDFSDCTKCRQNIRGVCWWFSPWLLVSLDDYLKWKSVCVVKCSEESLDVR